MTALAPTLQAFFTERLARQKNASPHTVAAYRDALRMLVQFAARRIGTAPARLQIEDVDAQLVGAFLDHLEHDRGNSARSRNTRLAAIHSLFGFAALRHPEHAALIARVLAIPPKRCDRAVVSFLTDEEIDALLTAPDTSRWIGRRDHTLLLVAVQTGLRVSELTALCCGDVHLGHGAHVRCLGLSRTRDKPVYAERWFMPSCPASGVDLPCGRGGSRLLSPELLGIIRGRRGRRAACRVPGSGRCWCRAVPCARALVR